MVLGLVRRDANFENWGTGIARSIASRWLTRRKSPGKICRRQALSPSSRPAAAPLPKKFSSYINSLNDNNGLAWPSHS
jgi:hypothetical protein